MTSQLTRYPPASTREVAALSFPFILILFSGSLTGLIDRLMLAHYSLESLEAAIGAFYLLQLFQVPCLRVASTAQIFVGQYRGAGQLGHIGPAVWQMIWFSFFSFFIITPLSWPISHLFFQNTPIQAEATSYFHSLIAANALFPLSAALASFYLGQGQTKKVLLASIGSHVTHVVLDFLLIFGIKGVISPLGTKGAAFALAFSQLLFCAVLLWDFLKPHHRQMYGTGKFFLQWNLFWQSLRIGLPRAGSKIVLLVSWVAITHVMVQKGGDYLVILAFGGSLNLFYTCFNEGVSQALTTIGAYLIGAQQLRLWKLAKSASFFLGMWAALLAIPCLLFPESLITLFFKQAPSEALSYELYYSCYWLWLLFLTHGLNLIALGLLNAYGDTLFQLLFSSVATWVTSFIPVYFLIGLRGAPPNRLWLIMTGMCLTYALTYFLRLLQKKWKEAVPLNTRQISNNL